MINEAEARKYLSELRTDIDAVRSIRRAIVKVPTAKLVQVLDGYAELWCDHIALKQKLEAIETDCTLSRLPPVDGFDRGARAARNSILQIIRAQVKP